MQGWGEPASLGFLAFSPHNSPSFRACCPSCLWKRGFSTSPLQDHCFVLTHTCVLGNLTAGGGVYSFRNKIKQLQRCALLQTCRGAAGFQLHARIRFYGAPLVLESLLNASVQLIPAAGSPVLCHLRSSDTAEPFPAGWWGAAHR